MITTAIQLRDVAKRVFEASDNPNRFELIDTIIDEIGPGGYESALRDALRMLVPQFSTQFRLAAFKGRSADDNLRDYNPRTGRYYVTNDNRVDFIGNDEVAVEDRIVSPRRRAVRDAWQAFLDQTIPLGGDKYIFLRDATVADLTVQYERRVNFAAGVLVQADAWKVLADSLEASGKERLGDVEEALVKELPAV